MTPGALDTLNASTIALHDRLAWQPAELVAVLGEHRGRHWGMVRCVAFQPRAPPVS